ncbi:MAG: amidohydrolase family protein, partial [Pseudomonadota bacterium]|nr:amidohydrolase family protein [Pseudomonadota bacterium]
VIDVHTHIVPESFPPYTGAAGETRWPGMAVCDKPNHKSVMIAGKNFRDVGDHAWDTARRLEEMAAEGVARQVLSPMPELLSYWFAPEDGLTMARYLNETIAEMVQNQPDALVGLGAVPLQDPDLAAQEMGRLRKEYGLVGVEVGTNVNGKPIGHPDHAPFFAAAVEHDLAVFVHALHPAGMERLVGPPLMQALVAFPNENSFAAASMISGGMLDKFPGLRIGFSHGAGSFAMVLPRLQHGWQAMGEKLFPRAPVDYAREMYYDTLVYDDGALRHLIETYGVSQLMVGSVYPFIIREPNPGERPAGLGLNAAELTAIHHGNCCRYLKLPSP